MSIYLHIPDFEGDVSAKGHEGWIAIRGMAFSAKRNIRTQPGRIVDREGSRPDLSEIQIEKILDKTSPLAFSEALVGTAKSEIKIHFCTTNSELTPYMEYILSHGMISSYAINAEMGEYPVEHLRINFDKIEMKFTPFDDNHTPQSPIPSGYDLKQAQSI